MSPGPMAVLTRTSGTRREFVDWERVVSMLFAFILLILIAAIVVGAGIVYILYRRFTRSWPHPALRSSFDTPQPARWSSRGLYISWIGHSTILMQLDGVRVMTDPVFSRRVGIRVPWLPFWTVGPRRHVKPALEASACTPIDVVLLSHAHMDHLDRPSLRQVVGPQSVVITPVHTSHLVRALRPKEIHEVEPGGRVVLANGMVVTAHAVRHWGNRFPWNRKMGYQGYVVRYGDHAVFFAGDTAMTDLASVAQERPQVAMMPIGAYFPETFQGAHCTPEQAWEMFRMTGATYFIPIHHDTFVLSQEPTDEPLNRLLNVAAEDAYRVVVRTQGATFSSSVAEFERPTQIER